MWNSEIKGFKAYLRLERALSGNSIVAYDRDVKKLASFVQNSLDNKSINQLELKDFELFVKELVEIGLAPYSQARIISGIKAFFKYLEIEEIIKKNPTELLEAPKLGRKLPDTLSNEEIEAMLDTIDRSKPAGERNIAIIETLYASGLRVSELVNMLILMRVLSE
jgi:integrase/recombinase XerD